MTLLQCQGLSLAYAGKGPTVRNINLRIDVGECVGLVGPSGSGKTTIARAILGLLPKGVETQGHLRFDGVDLLSLDEEEFRRLRGKKIGYVAQDPYQACDPLRQVGGHVAEAWRVHGEVPQAQAIEQRLDDAGVHTAGRVMMHYPHQWSGGMLQRASIVAATAHRPRLLVADEPTSALDAERADAIISSLKASGSAILLISHDLDLVMRHADRIALCDGGELVDSGAPAELLSQRGNTYTRRLIAATTTPFDRRLEPGAPCLEAKALEKTYEVAGHRHQALAKCDLVVRQGEIVGISGPSGCGKSTLLRLLAGMESGDAGRVERSAAARHAGAIMPVFQDPVASLDARWPVWRSVVEPLTARHLPRQSRAELRRQAEAALASVGLAHIDPLSLPGELSSGQCQRVCLARALVANPAVILADEPTSALDTLAKRQVLDLMIAAASRGTAIVMVSHDRKMLSQVATRVLTMQEGRLS